MKWLKRLFDALFIKFGSKCPVCNKPSTYGTTCSEECYHAKEYYETREEFEDDSCPDCGRYYRECECGMEEEA